MFHYGVLIRRLFQRRAFGRTLFAAGLFAVSSSGVAQDAGMPTNTLSLTDVKRAAFERNWTLLAAKSGVDAATAQLIMAREYPNPTASISTYKIGESAAGTSLGNGLWDRNYDSLAAVSQFFEVAGKRGYRQAAARAGVLGAKARFCDAKRTLDQGVTKAYVAALFAGENTRNLKESAGFMRHEAKIAEAQQAAGDLSDADLKTIEVNAEQFELQAAAADAAAVQARIQVEILMGVNRPEGHWTPADKLEDLTAASESRPAPGAATDALRPDVLAAATDLRAAEANLKLQKAERIPDPTVFIGAEHNPPGGGPAANTVNFGVSFPLPLWNLNRGNISAAQASVDQSRLAWEQLRAQAAADLATATSEFEEADARWRRYRDQTAPESAKVRDTIEFKYQKGAATLLDLLNAEQTDNSIRLAYAQAMRDTVSAAADLSAAQLTLSDNDLNSEKWQR